MKKELKIKEDKDWTDDLSSELRDLLNQSIDDADNGNDEGIPHEMMVKEAREKYPNLIIQ